MTPEEFARICEWDAKCTAPEGVMFGTTIDRRRLIEYVKDLQAEIALYDAALDTVNGLLVVFVKAVAEIIKP